MEEQTGKPVSYTHLTIPDNAQGFKVFPIRLYNIAFINQDHRIGRRELLYGMEISGSRSGRGPSKRCVESRFTVFTLRAGSWS